MVGRHPGKAVATMLILAIVFSVSPIACFAADPRAIASSSVSEPAANSEEFPQQILRTGVNLEATTISPNSRQLAESLGLIPVLLRIQSLRGKIDPTNFEATTENIALSQQLTASTVKAMQIIDETNLAIEFVMAEIGAEQNLYSELLSTFSGDRDKAVLKTNAISFVANGALWAVGEALDIPTNKRPNYCVSSGTFGILAGIVPSIASMYALYQLNGKQRLSEKEPNMMAKLFHYPTDIDIDYPAPVWNFLNSVPPADKSGKTRRDQLIDRWIADKNIPHFTNRQEVKQLNVITASVPEKKGLSIANLNTRQAMLQQLGAEIMKMKRLLYELSMAVRGEKEI